MADEKAAKEYLLQVKRLDTQVNNNLERLSHLKGMVMKVTSTWKDDVSFGGSGNQDKLGDAVSKIVDLENEISADIDACMDKMREINAIIELLPNPEHLRLLHLLYFGVYDPEKAGGVKYLSWEEIGEEMHMTARNAQLLHGRALQAVSVILEGQNAVAVN